jgi:hypothetical protein
MNAVFVTFQFLLLLPALPLALMSWRTTRALRARHQGMMTLAALLAAGAVLLALLSLSVLAADESVDLLLTFAPPLATLTLCAAVLWRGLSRPASRSRRSAPRHSAGA